MPSLNLSFYVKAGSSQRCGNREAIAIGLIANVSCLRRILAGRAFSKTLARRELYVEEAAGEGNGIAETRGVRIAPQPHRVQSGLRRRPRSVLPGAEGLRRK